MAKSIAKVRGKFTDEKYTGPEPVMNENSTLMEEAAFYNWYNYYYSNEDAKNFAIAYLKLIKFNKTKIKKISNAPADKLRHVGFMCRSLMQGSVLPKRMQDSLWKKVNDIAATTEAAEEVVEEVKVVSIKERVNNKAESLIANIEDLLDEYYTTGKTYDFTKWFRDNAIKPQIAQKIADYYRPLYSEIFDAYNGKDKQLVEGYSQWKKTKLKHYLQYMKDLISAAEQFSQIVKQTRKPRKKKVKPASQIVSKVVFKAEDTELNIKSVQPTEIVGSQQLWTFNTKYRTLTVYNAMGPSGLSVKGTTLTGFDDKTSIVKTLRKPNDQLKALSSAGKVQLRKFMDNIKAVAKQANGRINKETVLVKVIK